MNEIFKEMDNAINKFTVASDTFIAKRKKAQKDKQ